MFARHLPASEDDPDFSEECVQPLPYPEEVAYPLVPGGVVGGSGVTLVGLYQHIYRCVYIITKS